jgi:hypothetical protein
MIDVLGGGPDAVIMAIWGEDDGIFLSASVWISAIIQFKRTERLDLMINIQAKENLVIARYMQCI